MCFLSIIRRHTICALVSGVQTFALPIYAIVGARIGGIEHRDIGRHVGLSRGDFLHLRIVGGDGDVAAALGEILARDQAGAIGQAFGAARWLRSVERHAETVEIILRMMLTPPETASEPTIADAPPVFSSSRSTRLGFTELSSMATIG